MLHFDFHCHYLMRNFEFNMNYNIYFINIYLFKYALYNKLITKFKIKNKLFFILFFTLKVCIGE